MELLSKEATGFKGDAASLRGPATQSNTIKPSPIGSLGSRQALIIAFLCSARINPLSRKVNLRSRCLAGCSSLRDRLKTCVLSHTRTAKSQERPLLVVDDLHVAVLLNPKLTHDDVVHTACGVRPGVGLIVPTETNAGGQWGRKRRLRLKTELTWAAPA